VWRLRRAASHEDEALSRAVLSQGQPRPLTPDAGSIGPVSGTLTRSVAAQIVDSLDDAKAEDIISLDLVGKTTLADVMIVASGRSNTHVGAIAERLIKALKDAGCGVPRVEGMPHNDWVLVDAGDVIVHVFRPEVRQFYNLEKLWGADRPAERRVV
jgi:ribosome-associated protein